jgi:ATP/maltotriose-dependent transcriptional regulator MalT
VPYANAGQTALVSSWLGALPEEAIVGAPALCLVAAWLSIFAGEDEDTERYLDLTEDGYHAELLPDGTRSIESGINLVRAFSAFGGTGQSRARDAARRAVELETDETSPWRAVAKLALGYSLYWSGEFSEARTTLDDAARLGGSTEQPLIVVNALALLSYVDHDRLRS